MRSSWSLSYLVKSFSMCVLVVTHLSFHTSHHPQAFLSRSTSGSIGGGFCRGSDPGWKDSHGWTTLSAPAPAAGRSVRSVIIIAVGPAALTSNCHWSPLCGAAILVPWKHAIIDGKVAADQVRSHGGIFHSKTLILVASIRLVFAIVDSYHTPDAIPSHDRLISWFRPLSALAKT